MRWRSFTCDDAGLMLAGLAAAGQGEDVSFTAQSKPQQSHELFRDSFSHHRGAARRGVRGTLALQGSRGPGSGSDIGVSEMSRCARVV